MSIERLKGFIRERWHRVPAAELSVKILDYLASLPRDEMSMLTFRSFLTAVGKKEIDSELVVAINILAGSRLALLDTHAMYIDDDNTEYEIQPEEFAEAQITGELIHPVTGKLVRNFENNVMPFFVPTKNFYAEIE